MITRVFTPVDYSRLSAALSSQQGWIELALILACGIVAWIIDTRLERRRAERVAGSGTEIRASLRNFAHAMFPLIALLLAFLARAAYRRYATPFFLDIVLP